MEYKINQNILNGLENFDVNEVFGSWFYDNELKNKYQNSTPVNHIIINDFLNTEYAEAIYEKYPQEINDTWHKYYNPLEVKYANDHISEMPEEIKNLFYYLSTTKMTKKFSEISGINDLQYDPFLHGAGLHMHPRLGRLNLHLDYEALIKS